ncbi:MAG: flagellar hook capping protein [Rhodospirillales bacterium 20-58-10]|nr:MAG: flagellar hook capping protein [Rhodospirillales bacterium 20-58-10]
MTNIINQNTVSNASVAASTTAFKAVSSTNSAGSASALTQQDFLQLLTAQLKYQTPSSPADPTQLASEFAAISTVNGITQLNNQVSNIQASTAAAQMAQASSLVGKQVAVAGNIITANASGAAVGAFNLDAPAQSADLTILTSAGVIAGSMNLGSLPAGQKDFSWAHGIAGTQYTYQISATDAAGAPVQATPYSVYTVSGVNVTGTSPTLNLQGTATPLPITSVQTVLGVATP